MEKLKAVSFWGEPERVAHIRPAGLLWLHGHGLDFTFNDSNKPWASGAIPAVYERSCQALTWSKFVVCHSQPISIVMRQCDSQIHSIDLSESCRACCLRIHVESSSLSLSFAPTLQSGSNPLAEIYVSEPWTCKIFECAHLKFTVSGRSKRTRWALRPPKLC